MEIISIAESIAEKHLINGITMPEIVAERNGIGYSFEKFDDSFLGTLRYDASISECPFHIIINKNQHRKDDLTHYRTRSTFGHELGHYFIPEHKLKLVSGESLLLYGDNNYNAYDKFELEAQIFSANLLMPKTQFKTLAKDYPRGMEAVIKLAKHFNTSISSCAFQYAKNDVMPCISIYWKNCNTFGGRWVSKSFQNITNDSLLLKFNPSRPIADSYSKIVEGTSSKISISVTNLSSWVFNSSNICRDMVLIEESMILGSYGGITLLYPTNL